VLPFLDIPVLTETCNIKTKQVFQTNHSSTCSATVAHGGSGNH